MATKKKVVAKKKPAAKKKVVVAKKKLNKKSKPPKMKVSQGKRVDINYVKTESYRTYHVDGIYGGITPSAKLYIELFIQRSVTPQIVEHKITKDGTLGEEVGRTGKKGIVREIESGLVMDIEVASTLRDWLNRKIEAYNNAEKVYKPKGKSKGK